MVCPKCGSSNTSVQIVTTGSVGASHTVIKGADGKRGHGCLYWITIGWIIGIFKLLFKIIMIPVMLITWPIRKLFGRKGRVGTANTISASKTINKTMCVCQDCGYSWKA